jgi:hypothetical protein
MADQWIEEALNENFGLKVAFSGATMPGRGRQLT